MQAIATLLQDDPYLKMTPEQRCDARRERKRKLLTQIIESVLDVVEVPIDKTQRVELPIIPEPEPEPEPDAIEMWVERQRAIHKPLWFSIVDEIDASGKKIIGIADIQRAVCKYFSVSRVALLSARRTADIVRPRQLAMYLCKMLTPKSLPEIGRRFGDKDHTTVLHAVRKIAALVEISEETCDDITRIRIKLGCEVA